MDGLGVVELGSLVGGSHVVVVREEKREGDSVVCSEKVFENFCVGVERERVVGVYIRRDRVTWATAVTPFKHAVWSHTWGILWVLFVFFYMRCGVKWKCTSVRTGRTLFG